MNEGELSGRLGLAGWPAVAEEAIIARDCLLAAHVGSRLHVCHVSTAGSVEPRPSNASIRPSWVRTAQPRRRPSSRFSTGRRRRSIRGAQANFSV